ncbi:hypothetical protein H0N98_05410 [Candidatus Micrarchaeota archaeon]|nr:hypothetical protein [Candidatus Micrarchaeota archaeon]
MSIYQKIERTDYKDSVLGLVSLKEQKGGWVSEQGLRITAEKGRIVATVKTGEGNASRSIVKRFEPSGKLESFDIRDSKAKIDVAAKLSQEKELVSEFMKQVERGVEEPVYKKHKMKQEQGPWVFREEAGKGWIVIDVIKDDTEIGVVVVESSTHKSVESVHTKKFNPNNELSSFDSATDYGGIPTIHAGKEEYAMSELLSRSNVKLREYALEQQEPQKLKDVLQSRSLMKK